MDYRALNSVTKFPIYPMPLIDDILHSLKSVRYMSTLDLNSDYHHIAQYKDDTNQTAFVTRHGTYAFQRLSFGLNDTPSIFQKLMDGVLKPVLEENVFVYLEDIIITADIFEEHLRKLETVFKLLLENGLTVNVKECKFARKEVNFLCFKIAQDGLKTDDSKIEAVKGFFDSEEC